MTKKLITIEQIDHLIEDNLASSTMSEIGKAFRSFTGEDLKEIASTIATEDLAPVFNSVKEGGMAAFNKTHHYMSHLKFVAKSSGPKDMLITLKTDAQKLLTINSKKRMNQTTILIPETQKRLNKFINNVARDFALLTSDEERGKYILKLAAYTSLFVVSFQSGAKFNGKKSFMPFLLINGGLTLTNRILEQAQKKMGQDSRAIEVTNELRKFIKIVNMGIGTGLTLAAFADGLIQTKLTVKDRVDTLLHSSMMALFSSVEPEQ